jgi:hypothetical protein
MSEILLCAGALISSVGILGWVVSGCRSRACMGVSCVGAGLLLVSLLLHLGGVR